MRARAPTDIGLMIRQRRRALHLRQHELAAKVGVSRQWIIDVEHGRPGVELGLVMRTLEVLGLHLDLRAPGEGPTTTFEGLPDLNMDALIEQVRSR